MISARARHRLVIDTGPLPRPSDLETEQQLLGELLTHNDQFVKVAGFLIGDHFAEALHGRIFYLAIRKFVYETPIPSDLDGPLYLALPRTTALADVAAAYPSRPIYEAHEGEPWTLERVR